MAKTTNEAQEYKLAIVGAASVGKSSLTIRFMTDEFLEEFDPSDEKYCYKL